MTAGDVVIRKVLRDFRSTMERLASCRIPFPALESGLGLAAAGFRSAIQAESSENFIEFVRHDVSSDTSFVSVPPFASRRPSASTNPS